MGPSSTCWLSKQKQYSPLDPQWQRTRVIRGRVQKRRRNTFHSAWFEHNSNFDTNVRKTQSLNSATKICSLSTTDFLNKTQGDELRPFVLQIRKRQHHLPRELAFKRSPAHSILITRIRKVHARRTQDNCCLFSTHRSILGVDAESSVGSVF